MFAQDELTKNISTAATCTATFALYTYAHGCLALSTGMEVFEPEEGWHPVFPHLEPMLAVWALSLPAFHTAGTREGLLGPLVNSVEELQVIPVVTGLELVPAVRVAVLAEALLLLAGKPDQLRGVLILVGHLHPV